ncbi:MAG TPA: 2Fe-2S iron-sulfur cluster-binding protein [Chlorobaculum sp.]|nr:2Fe-2S iron-sulfur cluster binding domain-containing protein [Geobacteraceae bacterium]HWR00547.1 2Fe-2S iron-sulfur cluster-binding protein [Chlorobaculum sp.]
MIIYINDRPCEAQVGDLLLFTAQNNKAHIGYICGGNGFCQSCFVYVSEGAGLLSPPSAEEKAFISDKLFQEGGRLACQSVIVGEGTIRVLSRAEKLRRIVLGLNVPGFITYAQTIGYNVVNQLPSGAANIVSRVREGRLNPADSVGRIASGIGPASMLVANTLAENLAFLQAPVSLVAGAAKGVFDIASGVLQNPVGVVSGAAKGVFDIASGVVQAPIGLVSGAAKGVFDTASGVLCSVSGGKLHLPGSTCAVHDAPPPALERITIKAK